jgi:hypothetical protein
MQKRIKADTGQKKGKNERSTVVISIRIPKEVFNAFRSYTDETFQSVLYDTVLQRIFEVLPNDKPLPKISEGVRRNNTAGG